MFTQPSVNQIASTYQVKPAPLAQKVEADKKQHGGIPQDLRQLLALNDITEGRNAMGIQQALQIPTNMPTVAQSLQQQAQQAIQARLMEQAREQQRLQQKPPTLPLGTPQPRRQPQGIDALETNVGEEYAHGGIIGDVRHFEEGGKTWIEKLLYSNLTPAEQARKESLEAQAEASRKTPTKANLERDINMAEVNRADPNKTQETFERLGMATRQEQPTQQVIGERPKENAPAAPATPAAPKQRVNAVVPTQPGGIVNALPPVQTEAYKILSKDMRRDPDAEAAALRAKYLAEVGNRDLSIYDKMAEELKARKERLNAPKAGYEGLMDYLENIALSGGRTSAESGARGASRQKQMQLAREAQQNELIDKILDLGMKKSEAQYGEKKGLFEMTQAERKSVYDKAYEAAKSVNASDDKAKELAQQAVLEREKMANQLKVAGIGAHDNLMSRAQALMKVTPGLGLEEAMKRASLAAGATQLEGTEVRALQAFNTAKAKLAEKYPEWSMPNTPKGREVRARYEQELAQARVDAGLPPMGINALPSAGGPTSSNIRSQADAIISGGR